LIKKNGFFGSRFFVYLYIWV